MIEQKTYLEEFIIFSPQQYVVVWHKDNPNNYTLQKQNLNYIIKDYSVITWENSRKTPVNRLLFALVCDIQSKFASTMYKIPRDQFINPWYLVWSIIYKKDKIDSFYDTLKKEPLVIKALLEKILAKTSVHYTTLFSYWYGGIKDPYPYNPLDKAILIEIYKLDIEFMAENYMFNITLHLYDITNKQFYKRIMKFNDHPDKNSILKFHDRVVEWHNNKLKRKKERALEYSQNDDTI